MSFDHKEKPAAAARTGKETDRCCTQLTPSPTTEQ
jgi:hypothetical protein